MQPVFSLSPADSARFDLRVIRGRVDSGEDASALLHAIHELDADVAIVRCPAGELALPQRMRASGLDPIHADTLVYYSRALQRGNAKAPRPANPAQPGLATASEAGRIAEIAAESFADYRSHYSANHRFARDKVLSGYIEWSQAFLASDDPNKATWVVRVEGLPQGFATCLINPDQSSIEIVLNAVSTSFMGRGLYGCLLREILDHYGNAGLGRALISTQVWNYVVQRAWVRAGMLLESAFDTYHINIGKSSGG